MHLLDCEIIYFEGIFIFPYFVEQFKPHFAVFMKRNQRILGKFLTKLKCLGAISYTLWQVLAKVLK